MISSIASATLPGRAQASAAVLTTQAAVTTISVFFLAPRRSAHAPRLGMVSMTMA